MAFEPVSYRLSENDLVVIDRAIRFRSVGWVTILVVALMALLELLNATTDAELDLQTARMGLALMLATLIFGYFVTVPRGTRAKYRARLALHEEMNLRLTDQHIEVDQPSGHFRANWHEFGRWLAHGDYLLLFIGDSQGIPLPRVQIGTARSAFIREKLIESGLSRPGRRRRTSP